MFLTSTGSQVGGGVISLRCPRCMHLGLFAPIGQDFTALVPSPGSPTQQFQVGHRCCPNEACKLYVFVVLNGRAVVASYPLERITFDASNVPPRIVESLQEAITCQASNCFKASAMMVRKCFRGDVRRTRWDRLQPLPTHSIFERE